MATPNKLPSDSEIQELRERARTAIARRAGTNKSTGPVVAGPMQVFQLD
jgi:hypothetical protein